MSRLTDKKIGFIGGGQMAEAIFGGMLAAKAVSAENITVLDISAERLAEIGARFGVQTVCNTADNAAAAALVQSCDIILLAVKPQYAKPVLQAISTALNGANRLLISIVGGATLSLLQEYSQAPVIRVMPNTPMLLREGVAGIAPGSACTDEHSAIATEIFNLLGAAYILPESLIDPLTGISGCGPAYAYMFIEALADGGVKTGLPRDMALKLAAQTLLGSAKMVLDGEHPGKLKDNVCSPGGATIAGVHALEQGAFRGTVINAVEAGMNRMIEVGKKI